MKLKLSILALFILVAISVKGAVVDTLAVYSEAMKKNVQVVVVSPENNHVPKPVVYLLHGYGGNAKTWLSMKPELKDIADRDGLIFVCPDGKNSWYWDSPKDPSYRYETFVSSELIKYTLDGLEKGTTYQLKGWQMLKSENAQLLIDGKPVESDYTFTAKDSSMEVQIAFTFNASELAGKELVTFEELYDVTNPDEPIKVAEHKDIKDKGQTVTVKEKPESPATSEEPSTPTRTGTSPKTGDNTPFVALFAMMGISAAGLIFAGYKRFRRVKKSK